MPTSRRASLNSVASNNSATSLSKDVTDNVKNYLQKHMPDIKAKPESYISEEYLGPIIEKYITKHARDIQRRPDFYLKHEKYLEAIKPTSGGGRTRKRRFARK